MTTPTPILFVLDAFEQILQMAQKAMLPEGENPTVLSGIHATATYEVSLSEMRNAFYFQSDSHDIDNKDPADVAYYVDWPDAYKLNPSHAFVDSTETTGAPIAITDSNGKIMDNRLLVKHDFIRYIAKTLFKTHLAVDLFSNEQALKDDLAAKGDTIWTDTIKAAITAAEAAPMTNADTTPANLCRVLFYQILAKDRNRFDDLDSLLKDGTGGETTIPAKFHIPFVVGDSISFKTTLKAVSDQHTILGSANPNAVAIADRVYAIKLKIVVAPTNVEVDTDDVVADATLATSRVVTDPRAQL
jgi:hypothetical protein